MGPMLELEEAQQRLLGLAQLMPIETVSLDAAQGRYLASDLQARRTQPARDLSAMDGYAIGPGEGPWTMVGESRAGTPYSGSIADGQAVRISTGAALPEGSDRILIQENAELVGEAVKLTSDAPREGQHVRRRGMDFGEGSVVLPSGTRIGPAQIALASSAGHGTLEVRKAPRIAVMDNGDELAADPSDCGPDQIPASNGRLLEAMLLTLGCEVMRIGPVPDERVPLTNALAEAESSDILVTSGGASVGDHDLIKPALEEWGAILGFWKVAIKPGKPLILATRGKQVILGLPGNPVSSFVTAFLFLLPLVRKAMGAAHPLPRRLLLPAAQDIEAGGGRREFLRAMWDETGVTPLRLQDSSALANLAKAQCLIDRPARAEAVKVGTLVPVYPLENGAIA
ncbi:molybdopterin molybdotransferase MoeA [Altererythrobacter lutimaris]|uniref:Molybdopterin molybdenumtransferase n=1 Tax=Altererythrobacter lutimaris TaxID=2743979 RepID=A0A850H7X2_9SPHN|nr:gephyrin-like molybdotransferase Glp [Altererythrobacter lutimaris]NVE93973.1 molybdopterin molybdotransferase MoeA [Altererythrobacter lutimaris]